MPLPRIETGIFPNDDYATGQRMEWLGDIFIERVIWAAGVPPLQTLNVVTRAAGYAWYRFWLLASDQVVERYFTSAGQPAGTRIDICSPLTCTAEGCSATDLLLDLWIHTDGRVEVHHEREFEEAVRTGQITSELAAATERHLRQLTSGIARNRFPPPLVRNWQVDPSSLGTAS